MNTSIGARQLDFNITVTDGGFFSAHPTVDWSMRTHPSPMSKFYYITEGRCRITIDGREYSAKAGDWFFIPARVEHSYNNYVGEPFKKYWMHFELYPHKNLVSLLGLDYKINPKEKKECDALFKKFATLYKKSGVADLISVKSVALELLSIFIRSSQKREEEISEDSDSLFPGVFLYIENNMSRQILLETLAQISHMHPTHFIRCFKKETGKTPMEYVASRKAEKAKILLESTELPISQIAERLGYYDSGYFAKAFKRRYSISPTAYRKICEKSIT